MVTAQHGAVRFGGRIGTLRENANILEWFRFLTERCVIIPAAARLPLGAALAAANAAGIIDSLIPVHTSRVAHAELRAVGLTDAALERATRRRLAMPRHDLVWRQRMNVGREHIQHWRAIESNAGPVHELLSSKQSFIVAGGHFTQAAGDARHLILPLAGPAVGGAVPRWRLSPFELRRRLDAQVDQHSRERLLGLSRGATRNSALSATVPDLWDRTTNWTTARATPSVQEQVLAELSKPGAVSQILVDAYWEKPTAYRRPFAGMAERGFALGAARIARLAQCPVVPFVAVLGPQPRTVVLDWGDPILPRAIGDKASDRDVIDEAVDFIERGVGRYPEQYVHPVGFDRVWNPGNETWTNQKWPG